VGGFAGLGVVGQIGVAAAKTLGGSIDGGIKDGGWLGDVVVTGKRLGNATFWENAGHSMMMGAYFGIQNAFGASGNTVIYGGGIKNNTFGDPNKVGNKEVYDMGEWSVGGDLNDFIDWMWNNAGKDRYDTVGHQIYKITPDGKYIPNGSYHE